MVKPALGYLDVVRRVRDAVDVPVAAYNVSGEYAMVEAAAAHGWIDREAAILETLTSIRRAGADVVLTYWAAEAARLLVSFGPDAMASRSLAPRASQAPAIEADREPALVPPHRSLRSASWCAVRVRPLLYQSHAGCPRCRGRRPATRRCRRGRGCRRRG